MWALESRLHVGQALSYTLSSHHCCFGTHGGVCTAWYPVSTRGKTTPPSSWALTHLPTSMPLILELSACPQGLIYHYPCFSDAASHSLWGWLVLLLCPREFCRRALLGPPFSLGLSPHCAVCWCGLWCCNNPELLLNKAKEAYLAHSMDSWKFQIRKRWHSGEGLWLPQNMAEQQKGKWPHAK